MKTKRPSLMATSAVSFVGTTIFKNIHHHSYRPYFTHLNKRLKCVKSSIWSDDKLFICCYFYFFIFLFFPSYRLPSYPLHLWNVCIASSSFFFFNFLFFLEVSQTDLWLWYELRILLIYFSDFLCYFYWIRLTTPNAFPFVFFPDFLCYRFCNVLRLPYLLLPLSPYNHLFADDWWLNVARVSSYKIIIL